MDAQRSEDPWRTDLVDVGAYLRRIGLGEVPVTAAGLRSMSRAHILAIPFENLEVLLGRHAGVGLDAVADKLIRRERGGYCFEHGVLFAAVAERLGFTVERRLSRMSPDGAAIRTHMALVITVEDTPFLVDIGFGAGMLVPMPLIDGEVVDQAGWKHRLVADGRLWRLEKADGADWKVLHQIDDLPAWPGDYVVADHYVSTHPTSPFTVKPMAMRLAEGVSRRLVGSELTTEYASGESSTVRIGPDQLGETLRSLDLVLEPTDLTALGKYLQG